MPQKKKVEWSDEEDFLIIRLVNEQLESATVTGTTAHNFGHFVSSTLRARKVKWSKIAEAIPSKSGQQCRTRWMNKLDPILSRSDWSAQEDAELLLLGYDYYPHQWTLISEVLPGRSPDQVKARWRSLQRTLKNHNPELWQQNVMDDKQSLQKPLPTNGERNQLHFY